MEEKDFQAEWIPHPLILYQSAVPAACSILQCKYSNMVKYNGPNDDDGTENCISYSKIVVNKYKYQHSRDTSIYKYQYIHYYCRCKNALCKLNLLQYYEYIHIQLLQNTSTRIFHRLHLKQPTINALFFHASIRNSSNIWTIFWFLKGKF